MTHYYLLILIHVPVKQTNKLFVPTCTRMCVYTNCGSKFSLFSLYFPVLILPRSYLTSTCTFISLNLYYHNVYDVYSFSPSLPPPLSLAVLLPLLSLFPSPSPLPLFLYCSLSYQWLLVMSMSMRDSLASFTCTRNSSIQSRDSLK